jgi:hypothetical protein
VLELRGVRRRGPIRARVDASGHCQALLFKCLAALGACARGVASAHAGGSARFRQPPVGRLSWCKQQTRSGWLQRAGAGCVALSASGTAVPRPRFDWCLQSAIACISVQPNPHASLRRKTSPMLRRVHTQASFAAAEVSTGDTAASGRSSTDAVNATCGIACGTAIDSPGDTAMLCRHTCWCSGPYFDQPRLRLR